jgi:hypothetical protein
MKLFWSNGTWRIRADKGGRKKMMSRHWKIDPGGGYSRSNVLASGFLKDCLTSESEFVHSVVLLVPTDTDL